MDNRRTMGARSLVLAFVGFTVAAAVTVFVAWVVNPTIYPFVGRLRAPSLFLVLLLSAWLVCGVGALWLLRRTRAT